MRRLVGVLAAVVMLCACTPAELAHWQSYAQPLTGVTGEVPCGQWLGTVRVAGFTDPEAVVALRLMWAESRCDPNAHNGSGATGLLQVMPMWANDCGGYPALLYDPQFNVTCAKHVYDVQGWYAWSTYPPW